MRPAEALLQLDGRSPRHVLGPRRDVLRLSRGVVPAQHRAVIAAAVRDVGRAGLRRDERALARGDLAPISQRNAAARNRARPLVRAFVLLRAVNVERKLVVERDVIELTRRLIVFRTPTVAAVGGHHGAAVVALEQDFGIARIDPDNVVVALRRYRSPRAAAVGRLKDAVYLRYVRDVLIRRVGENCHVVEGALAQLHLVVHALPRLAAVHGAEHAAVLRLHDGVNAAGVGRRNRDAHVPEQAGGESGVAGDLRPVRAAVGRLVETAARAAAGQFPRHALRLPHRGVQRPRIVRVHDEIARAGVVVNEENLLPRLAAVGGLEDAAFGIGLKDVAQRGRVHDVRILRIHGQRTGRVRIAQAGVVPSLARVGGFKDPGPGIEIVANVALAGAGVNHAGVGGRDRERADRIGDERKFAVADVRPLQPVVGALPNPALDAAEVKHVGLGRVGGDRDDPAADVRPDVAPRQLAHQLLRRWRGIGSPAGERQREREHGEGRDDQLFHAIPYDGIKPRNDWGPACLLPCEQAVYRAES